MNTLVYAFGNQCPMGGKSSTWWRECRMCLRLTERADGSHGGATRIRDMAALSLRPTLTEVSKVLTPCHVATPLRWELRHPGARVA